MLELRNNQVTKEVILAFQDCDKTMSKDGKDGKDDVGGLAQGYSFGEIMTIDA